LGKRILISRTDRVGDVVMITPMIREIRKTYPDAFIATLTQPATSKILENNPHLDLIITDDLSKESFWKVLKKIRSEKFDYGLLVFPTERSAYQMFLAGIRTRIGVGRILYEVITFMKSVSRNNYIPLRHEADYCMDLARRIGVKTDNYKPEIHITREERIWTDNFFNSIGAGNDKFRMIIHTGSKNSAPNWSEEKYFELIHEILCNFPSGNFVILLTAFEMTEGFREKIKSLNDGRIIDISEKIGDLRELIKVISGVDLMICSSTGPAHLSDALGIRSIVIHCRRAMNCVKYWGILNGISVNLEVTKEYCDANCSTDKKKCNFENGISVKEVIMNINFNVLNEIQRTKKLHRGHREDTEVTEKNFFS